ncbi:hypothetical protein N7931_11155 [Catenovulum sp. 2E275]|uniref:hypothetical protein n=1 Tax=Catenovulum sp. 2E275 TaxID=2980497 RepID=UPI0021D38049|nr:hypothetical protein [Catenovulum sp. 2E275]MCU4676188.1 hypothetical protein [Catenovulum sp. 2E275]
MDLYVERLAINRGDEYLVDKISYETSGLLADHAKARIKFKEPEEIKKHNYTVMSVSNLDEVNSDFNIWGNETPKDRPDMLGFLGLSYIETSDLLLDASEKHPYILIYRGIDSERMKEGKPCYGGFFIRAGKPIVVDELNCVKLAG